MISKNGWNVYCTRFLVRARRLTEPIAFTDPFGHEHVGRPGDYLVETSNGIRRIATRAFFEDAYLPLSAAGPELADSDLRRRPARGIVPGSAGQPPDGTARGTASGIARGLVEDRPSAMA
ncbi:MAG: hypothetical protein WB983_05760 [Terriglobales bacterium]